MTSFAESYVAGETPIPCVTCNQQIKFRDLLETAQGSRRRRAGDRPLHSAPRRRRRARSSAARADADRDQSYFLFATTREQLRHLWFPLGGMRKGEVRALAHELALARRRKVRQPGHLLRAARAATASVIERLKPGALKPGDIVHVDGRRLGRHDGIINYTIGQRRGLEDPGARAAVRRAPRCRAQRGRGGTA